MSDEIVKAKPVIKTCWYCDGKGRRHGALCPICLGDGVLTTAVSKEQAR